MVRLHKVLTTQRNRVHAHLARGLVDDTFQRICRLWPARAAIGIYRCRVGEHGLHVHVDQRHRIVPRHQCAVQERRRRSGKVGKIRANIRHRFSTEGEEVARFIQRQLDLGHMVATMSICQKRFRTVRGPFDRTIQTFGGGQHQGLFAIVVNLRTKATAHVRGDHSQLVLGNAQHKGRNQKPRQVRVLRGRVQHIFITGAIVFCH